MRLWLLAEQTLIHRRVDPLLLNAGNLSALPAPFRAESQRIWWLQTRVVPRADVRVWSHGNPSAPGRALLPSGQAVIPLHPLNAALAAMPQGPALFATPTSSARTLLVWSPVDGTPPMLLKVSLPRVVAAEHRGLTPEALCTSVGKSARVSHLRGPLRYAAEPLAVLPHGAPHAGFILRVLPAPARGCHFLPLYAFTHPEARWPRPILRDLVTTVVNTLVDAEVRHGVALEAHAQNVLVEVDPTRTPTGRLVFRDMEGLSLDLSTHHVGLPTVTHVDADHESADHPLALERSLHTFVLGGLVHGLSGKVGASVARTWFNRALHAATGGAANSGPSFRRWVESQRFLRTPKPRLPRPLRAFIHREQTQNDRVRHPRLFAPVDLGELPPHLDPLNQPAFALDALRVPAQEVEIVGGPLPAALRRHLCFRADGRDFVRFPIHPAAAEEYALDVDHHGLERGVFAAAPTASPRSLVVWGTQSAPAPFGLKLSLPISIQRIVRTLRTSKLRRAPAVTRALNAIPARERQRAGLCFFPEPISLRLRHRDDGSIVRILPPQTAQLLPGFSLVQASRPPSLRRVAQMWNALVRASLHLFLHQGLLADVHQQNVLFQPDGRGGLLPRVWLRDLDAVKPDLALRVRRGLSMRAWRDTPGSLADLKLDETHRWYDDAVLLQLRAEWVFVVARARGTHTTPPLNHQMDRLILAHVATHLGLVTVLQELAHVLPQRRRGGLAGVSTVAQLDRWLQTHPLPTDHHTVRPPYSVNAMVHAWKAATPVPTGTPVPMSTWTDAARAARTTPLKPRTRIHRVSTVGDALVAWDGDDRPVAYGLSVPRP